MQAADPQIIITNIPPMGTGGYAEGKVVWSELSASNAAQYAVIAMLRTGNGFVKPTWDEYLTTIDEQGIFSMNITTGGIGDFNVVEVAFYLVLRSTFAGIPGETVNIAYMNNTSRYICSVTIDRNVFWEGRLLPPTSSITPGFVATGSTITLSCQSCQSGETFLYTVDGSDPISSATAQTYTSGTVFTVPTTGSLLVKAVTTLSGLYSSPASFVWLPQEPLTTPFWGLNVSLALNGETFGYSLSEDITRARMQPVAPLTKWIRTFGTINNGHEYINKIAKDELGLHTMIGVYVTNNTNENNAQIQGLRAILDMGTAPDLIAVGNEISQSDVTPAILVSCIDSVRKVLKERKLVIPVGSVDIFGAWSQSVAENLDFIGVNIYNGTWDDTHESQMLTTFLQSYADAIASFPSKLVLLTETGTPYSGDAYIPKGATQTQTPSLPKAVSYLDGFLDFVHNNVPAFYFEAYDEPTKVQHHQVEPYFGLMNSAGTIHSFYQDCINKYIPTAIIITPDNNTKDIILYPNPVSGDVHIDGVPGGATITIMDASGKIVKTFENTSGSMNVSHLPQGVYFVNVNKKTLKMIKN
jgi:exo-beta-1,3-glucanase (GH17 family)